MEEISGPTDPSTAQSTSPTPRMSTGIIISSSGTCSNGSAVAATSRGAEKAESPKPSNHQSIFASESLAKL